MAYDWALIKREYVQGYNGNSKPTLDELVERHGCSRSTIMKKSASENWSQERKIFGRKKEEKIEEKKINILAEESANIDNKALTIAEKGLDRVKYELNDPNITIHDSMKLSTTATNYHRMGKLALGEPTERTEQQGKINHEVNIHDRIRKRARYYQDLNTRTDGND